MLRDEMAWVEEIARTIAKEEIAKAIKELTPKPVKAVEPIIEPKVDAPTEEVEKVMDALYENRVPDAWKFCYMSLKPL